MCTGLIAICEYLDADLFTRKLLSKIIVITLLYLSAPVNSGLVHAFAGKH